MVEIGYGIPPQFQRQGFAPEAVQRLLTWAFAKPEVNEIIAETLPELPASI
jgi:RimJ/RimL family protein N-acetyltransferase